MRKAKIVATLGPASTDETVVARLARAGVDVFRLNFSFGKYSEHERVIKTIRRVAAKQGRAIAILQDLQGPKIRVGHLREPISLSKGDIVTLSGGSVHRERLTLPTTYKGIAADTKPGKSILMADGRIMLTVLETDPSAKTVRCEVLAGGVVLTGKGINLPYTDISLPALTKKDREDAVFGLNAGVDYMGLSFVRHAEDVGKLSRLMKKVGIRVPIISKIEKPEALDNFDEILEVTDGVMVARGDLAVEISFARVPVVQKDILRRADEAGKLTIVATEMLSSMVENPRPTRAEASDVANAVLDGTDAVMLSNETAMGKYPVKAVEAMSDIVSETEKALHDRGARGRLPMPEIRDLTEGMCASAANLSYFVNERAMAVITHTGKSVLVMSKYRPSSQIFAATSDESLYRRMALFHNVHPVLLGAVDLDEDGKCSVERFEALLKREKMVGKNDSLIFITGDLTSKGWRVNTVKVKVVD